MFTVPVQNELPVTIEVYERDPSSGRTRFLDSIDAGQAKILNTIQASIRVVVAESAAIILDRPLPIVGKLVVDSIVLTAPNSIPPPPSPSAALLIPPDPAAYLVGIGAYATKPKPPIVLLREQFWRKGPESFSLPPRSSIQKILRQTSGRTATSSTTDEVTKALSLQASAGWGPFSAAASASLSTTSQRTDTLTVREESSASIVQTFSNETDLPVIVCLWQLVDRIRVVKEGKSVAAVDCGLLPLIPLTYQPSSR
ncbi:MAG TPA: hypothetical protein VK821_17645 [Dehalococcoidia bacterium]|nr:hypothetical protein [Dehalococcoidia bacterium]